jgi:hypothetical protein
MPLLFMSIPTIRFSFIEPVLYILEIKFKKANICEYYIILLKAVLPGMMPVFPRGCNLFIKGDRKVRLPGILLDDSR